MTYDGSQFVGLDEDCVDEDTDSANPLDSWLEFALLNNERYLIEHGHQVSYVPRVTNGGDYSSGAGERAWASVDWTHILFIPWIYQTGLEQVSIAGIARVADETADNNRVVARANVWRAAPVYGAARQKELLDLTNTESSTPVFQDFEVAVTLTDVVEQEWTAPLSLEIQSTRDDTDIDTMSNGTGRNPATLLEAAGAGGAGFFTDTAATRPNADALDIQYSLHGGTGAGALDHVKTPNDDDLMFVAQPTTGAGEDLSRRALSYVQLRGLSIRSTFADNARLEDGAYAGLEPVLAEVEMTHPVRRDNVYRRARPVWVGPQGHRPASESDWPSEYTVRFARVSGDDSSPILWSANVWVDSTDPTLRLLSYVIPYHYVEPSATISTSFRPSIEFAELAEETAATASWDVWAVARALEAGDADWSAAATVATLATAKTSVTLTHPVTDISGASPFLLQEYLYWDGAGGGWAYREGQLFEGDLVALAPYLHTLDIELDLTWAVGTDTPIRVDFYCADPTDPVYGVEAGNSLAQLKVCCVGASVWEYPQ